jgi:hypothetical protein
LIGRVPAIIREWTNSSWLSSYGRKTIVGAMVEGFEIIFAWKMVNPKEYWVK